MDRVRQFLHEECLVPGGAHLVVGISGGPDSVALAHMLRRMDLPLTAAHVNHGMRGADSDADEVFVKELCREWDLPLFTHRLAVVPASEDEARVSRLGFLRDVRDEAGAEVVVLGHHRDDQAETVLMNVVRGAGLAGLRGILPRRGVLVHPLLSTSREEILDYCRACGLAYRTDRSNETLQYRRNRVRRELIPYIKKHFNPSVDQALAQTAEIVRREEQFAARATGRAFRSLARPEGFFSDRCPTIEYRLRAFVALPRALQRRLIRLSHQLIAASRDELSYRAVEDLLELIHGASAGKRLELPGAVVLHKGYGRFIMGGEEAVLNRWEALVPAVLPVPGRLILRGGPIIGCRAMTSLQADAFKHNLKGGRMPSLVSHAFIDYNKVDLPLTVRSWRSGDRMRPLGLGGQKKLQDLFVDEKIPRLTRDHIPLIVSNDKVVWVAGQRIDNDYRVDGETQRILHMWIDHSDLAEIPVESDVGHVLFVEGDENEMDPDFP